MPHHNTLTAIRTLDTEFQALTGHQAYGWISAPTTTSIRVAFHDGEVFTTLQAAYEHMTGLLTQARTDPANLRYPYDQDVRTPVG